MQHVGISIAALAFLLTPSLPQPEATATTAPGRSAQHGRSAQAERGDQENAAPGADAEARKRAKVRDLMEQMGQKELMRRTVDQMMESLVEAGMPEGFLDQFRARFDLEEVLEFTIQVHCDHLDEKTVDAMTEFYASEEGKKLAQALPDITLEAMKKGQEYGKRIAAEIVQGK